MQNIVIISENSAGQWAQCLCSNFLFMEFFLSKLLVSADHLVLTGPHCVPPGKNELLLSRFFIKLKLAYSDTYNVKYSLIYRSQKLTIKSESLFIYLYWQGVFILPGQSKAWEGVRETERIPSLNCKNLNKKTRGKREEIEVRKENIRRKSWSMTRLPWIYSPTLTLVFARGQGLFPLSGFLKEEIFFQSNFSPKHSWSLFTPLLPWVKWLFWVVNLGNINGALLCAKISLGGPLVTSLICRALSVEWLRGRWVTNSALHCGTSFKSFLSTMLLSVIKAKFWLPSAIPCLISHFFKDSGGEEKWCLLDVLTDPIVLVKCFPRLLHAWFYAR